MRHGAGFSRLSNLRALFSGMPGTRVRSGHHSLGMIRWDMVKLLSQRRVIMLGGLATAIVMIAGFKTLILAVAGTHLLLSVVAWQLSRQAQIHRTVFLIGTLIDPLFLAILFLAVHPSSLMQILIYTFSLFMLGNTIPLLSTTISNLACLVAMGSFIVAQLLSHNSPSWIALGAILHLVLGLGQYRLIKAMFKAYRATMHYFGHQKNRREAAARSSREKADFLANMNHELRTPLNGIIGMTGLLLSSPLQAEQEDYARTIRSSAEMLLTLINDILDMSRAEAGQLQIEKRAFELEPVIELVTDNLKAAARDKGIMLSVAYANDLPKIIVGDANRINQILFNLVGNAIKFTHHGRVSVTVSIHPDPADLSGRQRFLRLSVSDTGIGIPPEQLDKIFDKYRQASIDIVRKFGGTGLGLAITRELVQRMNGTITVTSELGKGSVFTATLSCALPDPAEITPVLEPEPARIKQATILLADDNPVNLSLLGRMVRNFGCQTREVRDGEEALAALQHMSMLNHVDLAILDYQMPGLNGFQVVQQLRAWEAAHHAKEIPVVILTGHLGSLLEPDFNTLSTVEIVEKPVRLHQLRSIVNRYLGKAQPPPS